MPFWTQLSETKLMQLESEFPKLIMSIGQKSFGAHLLRLLNATCGAEHASVFNLTKDDLVEITAVSIDGSDTAHRQVEIYLKEGLWRKDPSLDEARQQLRIEDAAVVRTDVEHLSNPTLRDLVYGEPHVQDRLLICARNGDNILGLSVLRTSKKGPFTSEDVESVRSISNSIFAVVAKHINLTWDGPDVSVALTSLEEIEACIEECASELPRREAQVSARIIFGMTTTGIGLELEISDETVMTYRKRSYQRLEIATQRELLLWYLELWSKWQNRSTRECDLTLSNSDRDRGRRLPRASTGIASRKTVSSQESAAA